MTFTVPYTQASADSQVVLYYLNTETGELEAVQTVYDPVAKTVTGTVDHMSYFAILEETSLGPLDESIALLSSSWRPWPLWEWSSLRLHPTASSTSKRLNGGGAPSPRTLSFSSRR